MTYDCTLTIQQHEEIIREVCPHIDEQVMKAYTDLMGSLGEAKTCEDALNRLKQYVDTIAPCKAAQIYPEDLLSDLDAHVLQEYRDGCLQVRFAFDEVEIGGEDRQTAKNAIGIHHHPIDLLVLKSPSFEPLVQFVYVPRGEYWIEWK
jgi:hypothetical protein